MNVERGIYAHPPRSGWTLCVYLLACTLIPQAQAQHFDEEIIVIDVTPVHGDGIAATRLPYQVQTAYSDDLARQQSLDLADFLSRSMGSVSVNAAQNNPLQMDVQYRGFTASPLLGLAQGLAVYQNGVRINEPLGDTVHWDLLPQSAVAKIDLIGGANPLFGLNTLGGALSVRMKNGFDHPGHFLNAQGGSFGRKIVAAESGGHRDALAYYVNVHYFDETGWRDGSDSQALHVYGSVGWQSAHSELNLNAQFGDSELIGNGPAPVDLLRRDRDAIFTAPDITENELFAITVDGSHAFSQALNIAGNAFYRRNNTDAFNGDSSEFTTCEIGNSTRLLEGLQDAALAGLALDEDDVCGNQFATSSALETFLNNTALAAGSATAFDIEDLTGGLSGTGVLADAGLNNRSERTQESYGSDAHLSFSDELFNRDNHFLIGLAYFKGEAHFDARLELAELHPLTRSTFELGTGTFVDDAATNINTQTETFSIYFSDTIDVSDRLSLTVSGRFNNTEIDLADRSGERPELNGEHDFNRFNPAVGATYQLSPALNLYGGYSESSRTPTPIELACNDSIFDLAVANAVAAGEDPSDIDFECRLPNAFLADPPLQQVVTKGFEAGLRGVYEGIDYHLGFFHLTNYDDIIFQTTGRSTGLFANVDKTRRWGLETRFLGNWRKVDWSLAYSYVEATFEDTFAALSPNHPLADPQTGTISIRPGNRIPSVPAHQLKFDTHYSITESLQLGFDVLYNAGQYLRGDESNQLDKLDDYIVTNLRGRYLVNPHLEIFAQITNLLATDYETFGLLGEDPSEADIPAFANFSDPRFLGPGAPRAGFAGIKLSF